MSDLQIIHGTDYALKPLGECRDQPDGTVGDTWQVLQRRGPDYEVLRSYVGTDSYEAAFHYVSSMLRADERQKED